jgi:Tat protein translocase TatB subunit
MGSIGAPEILVILVVALLVLGPNKLPEAARQAGRALAELRKMSAGFQAELRDVINTPEAGPPAPGSAPMASPPAAEPKFLWSDLPAADGGDPSRPG